MHISDLYDRHKGGDVYVIGTGPSLRTFPLDFFRGRTTIGLNQAWKYLDATYSLTVHPELLLEWEQCPTRSTTHWLVKKKPPLEKLELDDRRYHVFLTDNNLECLWKRPADTLYIGRGVQCTALDLAARMGAANVILVGCDGGMVGTDHHGHEQHVRFLGVPQHEVYAEYRKWTAKVRFNLRQRFGTRVLTMTPFVSVCQPDEDYWRLCRELGLPRLPYPKDVSPYKRKDHPHA